MPSSAHRSLAWPPAIGSDAPPSKLPKPAHLAADREGDGQRLAGLPRQTRVPRSSVSALSTGKKLRSSRSRRDGGSTQVVGGGPATRRCAWGRELTHVVGGGSRLMLCTDPAAPSCLIGRDLRRSSASRLSTAKRRWNRSVRTRDLLVWWGRLRSRPVPFGVVVLAPVWASDVRVVQGAIECCGVR